MKEETRPTIYRVMKYWGKKPHNIWGSYIEQYSKENDVILDPFVGSGMTYFEAIKTKRIPYTIDINPISELCIRCLSYRDIDFEKIISYKNNILKKISQYEWYKNEFVCECSECGRKTTIFNYKTNGETTISYRCNHCNNVVTDIVTKKDSNYKINRWVPHKKLSDIASVSDNFIKKIGSNDISSLWSNRNLKTLSEIYYEILNIKDEKYKEILVFAFIQCLHLTSKMCIPRSQKSHRPLSTSWGRPAYILSKKIFEQNPLIAFEKAVTNSTGVINGIKSSEKYLGCKINKNAKHILGDSMSVLKQIKDKTIDMIISDPPYGNIIQYGDLSEVWVSWLTRFNEKYVIDHKNEIIVNSNKTQGIYRKNLQDIFQETNRVLKDKGVMILTFNSNNNDDWASFLGALKESNYYIEKTIYQKNLRSSEANVNSKEGIGICDYYFICKKGLWKTDNIAKIIDKRGLVI